jgi:hypothetical protein
MQSTYMAVGTIESQYIDASGEGARDLGLQGSNSKSHSKLIPYTFMIAMPKVLSVRSRIARPCPVGRNANSRKCGRCVAMPDLGGPAAKDRPELTSLRKCRDTETAVPWPDSLSEQSHQLGPPVDKNNLDWTKLCRTVNTKH